MSSEPYLICHIVRGQPAFDIAEKIQIGNEEGWIIPTSGHRAYPYWSVQILCDRITSSNPVVAKRLEGFRYVQLADDECEVPDAPPNWPDHYEASPAPKGQGTALASSILERLGLLRKATIRRR